MNRLWNHRLLSNLNKSDKMFWRWWVLPENQSKRVWTHKINRRIKIMPMTPYGIPFFKTSRKILWLKTMKRRKTRNLSHQLLILEFQLNNHCLLTNHLPKRKKITSWPSKSNPESKLTYPSMKQTFIRLNLPLQQKGLNQNWIKKEAIFILDIYQTQITSNP